MIDVDSIDYAHARLWACNAARPDESDWRRIELVRDFAALLDTARRLPALHDWVASIAPDADLHDVEAILRTHWRVRVAAVATWMPQRWQSAVVWCAALVDIPIVAHLARGDAAMDWMHRDASYRDLAQSASSDAHAAPRFGTLAPLSRGWREPDLLSHLWLDEWRRRLPHDALAPGMPLRSLADALSAYRRNVRAATMSDAAPLRRSLHAKLEVLFRRAMIDPAAAFAYLALYALDLMRLRGELVSRVALPHLLLAA